RHGHRSSAKACRLVAIVTSDELGDDRLALRFHLLDLAGLPAAFGLDPPPGIRREALRRLGERLELHPAPDAERPRHTPHRHQIVRWHRTRLAQAAGCATCWAPICFTRRLAVGERVAPCFCQW